MVDILDKFRDNERFLEGTDLVILTASAIFLSDLLN